MFRTHTFVKTLAEVPAFRTSTFVSAVAALPGVRTGAFVSAAKTLASYAKSAGSSYGISAAFVRQNRTPITHSLLRRLLGYFLSEVSSFHSETFLRKLWPTPQGRRQDVRPDLGPPPGNFSGRSAPDSLELIPENFGEVQEQGEPEETVSMDEHVQQTEPKRPAWMWTPEELEREREIHANHKPLRENELRSFWGHLGKGRLDRLQGEHHMQMLREFATGTGSVGRAANRMRSRVETRGAAVAADKHFMRLEGITYEQLKETRRKIRYQQDQAAEQVKSERNKRRRDRYRKVEPQHEVQTLKVVGGEEVIVVASKKPQLRLVKSAGEGSGESQGESQAAATNLSWEVRRQKLDAVVAAREKALAEEADRARRRKMEKEQKAENFKGAQGSTTPRSVRTVIDRLEATWRDLMLRHYPNVVVEQWGPKQFGQVKTLLKSFDERQLSQTLRFLVAQWDGAVKTMYPKTRRSPSVGLLAANGQDLVNAGIEYSQAVEALEELAKARGVGTASLRYVQEAQVHLGVLKALGVQTHK